MVSSDKEARMLYKARLKSWRDEQVKLEDAETRGMEKRTREIFALWKSGVSLEEAEKRFS
ncbi:MAG: hypothetical protein FWH22_09050 [Fibromonadales bacterium]|nr:hypothetical protein [Fibromonadales bacterium]